MKSILKSSLIFCLVLLLQQAYAQKKSGNELKIGDTIPNLMVKNLWKQQGKSVDLKTLCGDRFLILNFFSTWCATCIDEMKLLSEMSEKYSKSLKIITVTHEGKADIDHFLKKRDVFTKSNLEVVTNDSVFRSYFYYESLPHSVWIDQKGVVCAITGYEAMDEEHISKFIQSGKMNFRTKIDDVFDRTKPLHIPDSLIEFRTIFNKKLKNNSFSGILMSPIGFNRPHMTRFFCFNESIIDLFWAAYIMPGTMPNEYLYEIYTSDSTRYIFPGRNIKSSGKSYPYLSDWAEDNLYSYDLISTKPMADSVFTRHAVSDLELNLGVKTALEYRDKVCCLVSFEKKPDSVGPIGNYDKTYMNIEGDKLIIKNLSVNKILKWMAQMTYKTSDNKAFSRTEPYVNVSGVNYTISFTIDMGKDKAKYRCAEYLEQQLAKGLGMQFKLETRPYKVLVMRDLK